MLTIQKTSQQKTQIHKFKSGPTAHEREDARQKVICNICKMAFRPHNIHELFCEQCRMTSETYRFAEWLVA